MTDALLDNAATTSTRVVMLGIGTPQPDPERSGPATVIVAGDTPYLIDFGAGVVRRATAAFQKGVSALGFGATNVRVAFLTHLHSDHTIGLPDIMFTPWVMGRHEPLSVYGPKGIAAMTEHVLKAWQVDVEARTNGINRHNATGCAVKPHEITPGVVYQDSNIKVTAFPVHHEEMVHSFGYRFDTLDRTIVISGDTAPVQSLVDHSQGCDVLIHEAYSMESYARVPARAQEFRRCHHTSTAELADIAKRVKPKLLVLYHSASVGDRAPYSAETLLSEMHSRYDGAVAVARDLDVF